MDIVRAFMRVHEDAEDGQIDTDIWQRRMDSLIISDPVEILSFISDAVMALAVGYAGAYGSSADDPEDAIETLCSYISRTMVKLREFDSVWEIVKDRHFQLFNAFYTIDDAPPDVIKASVYQIARSSPYEDDKRSQEIILALQDGLRKIRGVIVEEGPERAVEFIDEYIGEVIE